MKNLIKTNLLFFVFYIIVILFFQGDFLFWRLIRSFLEITFLLVFFGINLTAIIQVILNKKFNFFEFLSIASFISLIFPAFLLSFEFTKVGIIFWQLPFINYLLSFLIVVLLYFLKNKEAEISLFLFENPPIIANYKKMLFSPLLMAFLFFSFSVIIINTAYYPLPDLDPYGWFFTFRDQFSNNKITSLFEYRSLFSSLTYILNQSSHIDLYAIFKFVYPSFILLSLIPAWMVAIKFEGYLKKLILLSFPVVNSSAFLYSQTSMPQLIAIIITLYFLYFLLYSYLTNNKFFYYLAGSGIFFGYFYHELLAVIFFVWIFITILFNLRNIFRYFKKNLIIFLFVSLLVIAYSDYLLSPFNTLKYLITKIKNSVFHTNFLFPANYTNIDGNPMGWPGWDGVLKYYLYYMGLPTIFILILLIFLFIINRKDFREFIAKKIKFKEITIIAFLFFIFFAVSEILPRISGIAFLPERAWTFGGIFSCLFFLLLFQYKPEISKTLLKIILIFFYISLLGAIYVNFQKKYVITEAQLSSAFWIKENTQKDRVIFSNGNSNLLKLYSQSKVITIPPGFFYDQSVFNREMEKFKGESKEKNKFEYVELTNKIRLSVDELLSKNPDNDKEKILSLLDKIEENRQLVYQAINKTNSVSKEKNEMLIYYSEENQKNPYLNRPYYQKNTMPSSFIFDNYPDKFEKIFEDKKNKIIIWKIKNIDQL